MDLKLNGKVKYIKEKSFELILDAGTYRKGKPKRYEDNDFEIHYNGQGYVVEKKSFIRGNQLSQHIIYEYENDNLIKERHLPITPEAEPYSFMFVYKYNPAGKLIQKDILSIDGQWVTTELILKYDDKGKLKLKADYNRDRSLKLITHYYYIGDFLVKKEESLNPGELLFITKYDYDAMGNLTRQTETHAKGTPISKQIFEYDSHDKLIKHTYYSYDLDGQPEYKLLKYYDPHGQLAKEEFYTPENELINKIFFNYDQYGNLIRRQEFNGPDRLVEEYKYRFDSHHNWIEKQIIINGKPAFLVERKIKYFE